MAFKLVISDIFHGNNHYISGKKKKKNSTKSGESTTLSTAALYSSCSSPCDDRKELLEQSVDGKGKKVAAAGREGDGLLGKRLL